MQTEKQKLISEVARQFTYEQKKRLHGLNYETQ